MSFERMVAGSGPGTEPVPPPGPAEAAGTPTGVPPQLRLQILSTEHWSLLASRSLAWNESFSRAGMFLSALSGAIVALALVSQASDFGEGFVWFALLILPVLLFIGLGTFIRQGGANYHDAFCVAGMNRIRAAYFELAPELEPYFMTSGHDDARGIAISMGSPPGGNLGFLEFIAATPSMIAILNGVITGVVVGLIGMQLGVATAIAVIAGIVGFAAAVGLQFVYAIRGIGRDIAAYKPMFPSPEPE